MFRSKKHAYALKGHTSLAIAACWEILKAAFSPCERVASVLRKGCFCLVKGLLLSFKS